LDPTSPLSAVENTPDAVPYDYVRTILAAYLALPDTPRRASPYDRRLARSFYDRGVPLATVTTAFLLVTARRRTRPPDAVPLASVRSLAYFLPAVQELLAQPVDPAYANSLRRKLAVTSAAPSG
jgi:hypothetical protein